MSSNSKIEWTEATWSPVVGCTKCSPGCLNCYAERMAVRQGYMEEKRDFDSMVESKGIIVSKYRSVANKKGWTGKIFCDEKSLEIPRHWRKPRMIFVCSMSDLFHPSVPFEFIDKVMAVIALCPQHTFQILTKRPERMIEYLKTDRTALDTFIPTRINCQVHIINGNLKKPVNFKDCWPLPNLWLGVTVCNQEEADKKIPILLQTPAAVRFVSIEPMLGAIDLSEFEEEEWKCDGCGEFYSHFQDMTCNHCGYAERHSEYRSQLDQVIVGGESGPGARPMHPDWPRKVRDQRVAAGVPFFFKQWGAWVDHSLTKIRPTNKNAKIIFMDGTTMPWRISRSYQEHEEWEKRGGRTVVHVGKKKSGRLLDGREWSEYPKGRR